MNVKISRINTKNNLYCLKNNLKKLKLNVNIQGTKSLHWPLNTSKD